MEPCNKCIQKTGLFDVKKVTHGQRETRREIKRWRGRRREEDDGVRDRRMKEGRNGRRMGGREKQKKGVRGKDS